MTVENIQCAMCNEFFKETQTIGVLECNHCVHTVCLQAVRKNKLEETCLFCLTPPKTTLIEFKENIRLSYQIGYKGAPDLVAIAILFSGFGLLMSSLVSSQNNTREAEIEQESSKMQEACCGIFIIFANKISRKYTGRELGSCAIVRHGVGATVAALSAITYPFSKCFSSKKS